MEHLNLQTFKEKIFDYENEKDWKFKGDKPAIIDFYAPWCGPCRMVTPIFDQLEKEYEGKIDFYKINTDEEQELAAMFGIMSIPSILFIPLNDKPQMTQGALPKQVFVEVIKDVLKIN